MSNEPATKEIVDEFDSGFAGTDVMRTVPVDYVEEVDPIMEVDPRADETEQTPAQQDDAFANPDAAKPAAAEPAAGAEKVDTPAAEAVKEMISVPAEEYKQMVSTVANLSAQFGEHGKKFDQAFGKIGGLEGFVKGMQKSTPAGEKVTISDDEMKALAEQFPTLSKELQPVLNAMLSKMHGTAQPTVQMVDDDRIGGVVKSQMEQERTRIKRELQREQVLEEHPDFDQVRVKPEFVEWLSAQPKERQEKLGAAWSPNLIIKAMDDFKAYKKPAATPPPAPDARAAALAAGVNPRGAGPAAKTGKPASDDDEFNAGFKDG